MENYSTSKFVEISRFAKQRQSVWLALNFVTIALLMLSRRPDALLHPQFWAEDGHIFYHDAYEHGAESLIYPLGGYLNSFSRLVAFFAVQFPLQFAPAIFVFFAFCAQILPPLLILSSRMDEAIPSIPVRVALSYFYVMQPNSWEINLNLTDAQWHLAIVSFLIIVSKPVKPRLAGWFDAAILIVSGLSGPFSLFLFPIALYDWWSTRLKNHLYYSVILTSTAIIQLAFIAFSPATDRGAALLGASWVRLCEILVNQIYLGGLIGDTLMSVVIYEGGSRWGLICEVLALIGCSMVLIAFKTTPGIFRRAAIFGGFLFLAALKSPLLLLTDHKWLIMTFPGHGGRYYVIPSLVWFATVLLSLGSPHKVIRFAGCALITCSVFGIFMQWDYPAYVKTGFTSLAEEFDTSPAGQRMVFPENPIYQPDLGFWSMVLVKR